MFRHPVARWLLLASVLIVIGLWPAAVAPIGLAASGAARILGAIPGPVLLAAAVVLYFRHRPARPATA